MTPNEYMVEIYWGWSGQMGAPFNEVERFCVRPEEYGKIREMARGFVEKIARRYCFDCGRKDSPLHLWISSVVVTPLMERERFPEEKWGLQEVVNEVRKALLSSGSLR